MKTKFYGSILSILFLVAGAIQAHVDAQGCVAVRQMGGNFVCASSSYFLPKGQVQAGVGYRYFHSWRHFVGTEEQPHRQTTGGGFDANGHERGNAVNIYAHALDFNFSYAISDRLQVNASIPFVHNERSQVLRTKTGTVGGKTVTLEGTRYSVYAKGLGDVRISANYWLIDHTKAAKGNVMVGLGVKLNTGSHTEKDKALAIDSETKEVIKQTQTMDQAIQPGDGGIGISVELQAFRQLYKGLYGFAAGYYLFNPRESNGSFKSAPTVAKDEEGNVLGTLTGYNIYASPDQYLARVGVMGSLGKEHNLTLSLAARAEGIPAYDAFGGQVAYRRPGYVVAVEPGLSYRMGKHSFTLIVPYNFIKNRIQSAADIALQNLENSVITDQSKKVHEQGDAAFADYSINFIYSVRLGQLF